MTREEAIKILKSKMDGSVDTSYEWAETVRMAIEALHQTKWIPCSERMPDAEYGEGDSVLCCTELGLMYILYWNGGNWCVPTGEPHIWVNHKTGWHDRVIAWMPLPEPYREDGEE